MMTVFLISDSFSMIDFNISALSEQSFLPRLILHDDYTLGNLRLISLMKTSKTDSRI